MSIYIQLLIVAGITTWIVDCSGARETLLEWATKFTKRFGYGPVKELRPFTCGLCATWWVGIIYSLAVGEFSLPVLGWCAVLAHFSFTLAKFFIFLREGLDLIIGRLMDICNRD